MYSLYRAHITGGKDFHKRATLQGKQHKKASTLFCGNGQNRALCLPRHCSLDPRPGFRVNVQRGAWSFCQAQSSVRSWPVDPAPPQFCLPSLEEPSHKPEVTTWNLRKPSHTPARAQGHMLKENVYIKNLGFVDQIYHQKAP